MTGGRAVWGKPNQTTTPLKHPVELPATITVVNPRFPLYGQSFTVRGTIHRPQSGLCFVVWLAHSGERHIPCQATQTAAEAALAATTLCPCCSSSQSMRSSRQCRRSARLKIQSPATPGLLPPARQQLPLPLTSDETPCALRPQEVWGKLPVEQQTQFRQQLIRLCCQRMRSQPTPEGKDE